MVSDRIRKQLDSRSAYVAAFIGLFFVLMLAGVCFAVGGGLQPRQAALLMVVPAALISLAAVRVRILRRIFGAFIFSG